MSKVIAILGAGTGLGISLVRRFGRENFRVALVARRKDRLDALVSELTGEGIEAAAFAADLEEPGDVRALIDAIRARFGRIDVVEYGPVGSTETFFSATDLDATLLERLARLLLLTPVEVFHRTLAEMIARGDGAILMTTGYSAVQPVPYMSGPGVAMAAARNYVYALNGELAESGVYAGTLAVAASINRSAMAESAATAIAADVELSGVQLPTVDPDELANVYWSMYVRRNQVELVHPRPALWQGDLDESSLEISAFRYVITYRPDPAPSDPRDGPHAGVDQLDKLSIRVAHHARVSPTGVGDDGATRGPYRSLRDGHVVHRDGQVGEAGTDHGALGLLGRGVSGERE